MGTSSSHSGNKDKKGLLPNDFHEQQPIPSVSWQTTKTGFSKYINGHGGSIGRTASNYVKASGGTAGLMNSSRSGIRGAVNIGKMFAQIQQYGYEKTFDDLGILYQGKSVREICSELINYVVESSDSKEDAAAKAAASSAVNKMYKYVEKNGLDIQALNHVDNELMDEVMCTYVECYIWERILNDLEFCLEKYSEDIEKTMKIENEMKRYVSNKVKVAFRSPGIREKILGTQSMEAGIEELYRKCYSAMEDM